jgi:hypothetical protein
MTGSVNMSMSSSKTGTELAIVPVSQLQPSADAQETDTEDEDTEKVSAATPDDIPSVDRNMPGLVAAQPQPSILQQIINWIKGLFN